MHTHACARARGPMAVVQGAKSLAQIRSERSRTYIDSGRRQQQQKNTQLIRAADNLSLDALDAPHVGHAFVEIYSVSLHMLARVP